MTHLELFHGLIATGMKMRYGNKPGKQAILRMLWEKKHIIDAGFSDYYLMAFWLFRHYITSDGISFWARGAMPSSIVCYCLGLTEIDPIKYGLHSVRFVNDKLPKFQFDIEASRFDEFMKAADEVLEANAKDFDIPNIKKCLLQDLTPLKYLENKKNKPLPENIDDEMARYALNFPQTMDLYETYVQNPKCNILIYQEQMLDILKQAFHVSSIRANNIRLSIQREDTNQVAAYKKELFAELKDVSPTKAEAVWLYLTSNPKAFLKAHAVSRVVAQYRYEY